MLNLASLVLLAIAFAGDHFDTGWWPETPPRSWEQYEPGLSEIINSLDSLLAYTDEHTPDPLDAMTEQERALAVYNSVVSRFNHGDQGRHTAFSNWILWSAGKVRPSLGSIWDPELKLRKTSSLLCGQKANILAEALRKVGLEAREVGLDGHVVLEVQVDGLWLLLDPDLEVYGNVDENEIIGVRALVQDAGMIRQLYSHINDSDHVKQVVSIFQDTSGHYFAAGTDRYHPNATRLAKLEKLAQQLKYVIPFTLIVFTFVAARPKRVGV